MTDVAELGGTEHHPHARAVLGAAVPPAGAPSHAYLLHGPAGTGKRTAALAFAAELLSEGAADAQNSRARVRAKSHPDLTWVTPSGAHELLVDDVRPIVSAASHTPFEARRRVFVIEAADTMNDESANRMLKTLEEPASFVHLLLLTDRPGEMLATISSRCQAVRFDPLPLAALADRLGGRGVAPDAADACARLARGDSGRALSLALGDGPLLRANAEAFATAALGASVQSEPWHPLIRLAKKRAKAAEDALDAELEAHLQTAARSERKRVEITFRDRKKRASRRASTATLDLQLELAGIWFRDLACLAWGAPEAVHNSDRSPLLTAQAGRPAGRLRSAVEEIEQTRMRLAVNVTDVLACETLAYRLENVLRQP